MAANPLEQAIRSGVRANDRVGELFADIGTSDHPRGFVASAYRNARRAMRAALREEYPVMAVDDVMNELRRSVASGARSLLLDAQSIGRDEAARQMSFYDVKTQPGELGLTPALSAQVAALEAEIEAQHLGIRALILTGAEEGQIVGDESRAGALRASDIAATLAVMSATLLWSAYAAWASQPNPAGLVFKKQAVAALDNRTTDCCLRVHGQVRGMNQPFRLTGTPRFADEMDWPGFHWWCRTAGVLYLDEFDMGLTQRMRDGAIAIINEREAGQWNDRHPADAFG